MAITLYRQDDGSVLTGDTVLNIAHAVDIQLPEQPIEDGSSIVDHAIQRPREFVLYLMVTETPFKPDTGTVLAGAARLQAAEQWLTDSIGTLLTLSGGRYGDIVDLMLAGFTHVEQLESAETFTIRLRQVQIATVESVQIPLDQPTIPTAASQVDSGQQATEVVSTTDPQVEADQSTLSRLLYGDP